EDPDRDRVLARPKVPETAWHPHVPGGIVLVERAPSMLVDRHGCLPLRRTCRRVPGHRPSAECERGGRPGRALDHVRVAVRPRRPNLPPGVGDRGTALLDLRRWSESMLDRCYRIPVS